MTPKSTGRELQLREEPPNERALLIRERYWPAWRSRSPSTGDSLASLPHQLHARR